jgi:outer membrane protein TolC
MKTYFSKTILLLSLCGLSMGTTLAQQAQTFSLREAVEYATKNHVNVKNAQLDLMSAVARIGEIKAIGLPQVNGNINWTDNLLVPRFFIPARTFDPSAPEGEVVAAKFGVKYSANAGVSLSQLLFDGSYLLGLKASQVYKELAQKNVSASKITVAENVAKAYYGVLVNEERLKLLDINVARLDSLFKDTKALNKQGFVEKIDVDRLEVQLNNLKTERQNIERLQELGLYLLKFQMSYKLNDPILLTDKLASVELNDLNSLDVPANFDYKNRIEYSTLMTQTKLAEMDVKNQQMGYYPRVLLSGSSGFSTGNDNFNIFSRKWFNATSIGLVVQVPIFDGFGRKYKIQQSRYTLDKIRQSTAFVQESIDLQIKSAQLQLRNNWETLQEQKKNMELAREIVRVSKIKYKEGVGTNLEVVNAESSYKEAQTNYYTTLYNAIVAKVELDKATGRLFVE